MHVNTAVLWYAHTTIIPAALTLLPGQMNSIEARAEMLAIGCHESLFAARVQNRFGPLKTVDPKAGPARGFWQFERMGGVAEILTSPDTRDHALTICKLLLYEPTPNVIHAAIAYDAILAAAFARLLLWRDPRSNPKRHEQAKGYAIYLRNWRPNPDAAARHAKDWPGNFDLAWETVTA